MWEELFFSNCQWEADWEMKWLARSPGVPVIPCLLSTSFCIFPWLCSVSQGSPPWRLPRFLLQGKIWLMGIYDRKLEVRRGEVAVSLLSFCLQCYLWQMVSCTLCLKFLPNKCPCFWDLVTLHSPVSLQTQEQRHLPAVANPDSSASPVWLCTSTVTCASDSLLNFLFWKI